MTDSTSALPHEGKPEALLAAAVLLIGRAGARNFQLRYSDDPEPVVWVADCELRDGGREACGALTPARAALRLCEEVFDGGTCAHCGRPSGVTDDWRAGMPMADLVCWYVFDPEVQQFRRSCEGETTGRVYGLDAAGNTVGRNDPCPCGSGEKWKRCHGA